MRLSDDAKYYIFMHEAKKQIADLQERIDFFEKKIDLMQHSFKEMTDSSNIILNRSMKRLKKFEEKYNAKV